MPSERSGKNKRHYDKSEVEEKKARVPSIEKGYKVTPERYHKGSSEKKIRLLSGRRASRQRGAKPKGAQNTG